MPDKSHAAVQRGGAWDVFAGWPVPEQAVAIDASGRFLTWNGVPHLVVGDSPWSLPTNCTRAQIDAYIADREAKGCTALLFELIEKSYTSQTPRYRNAEGNDPFTSITGSPAPTSANWILSEPYWDLVDYVIDSAKAAGMLCFVTPAYAGYGNGTDGWLSIYSGESDATLQNYGAQLATRYASRGNVVWVLGGDYANDAGAAGDYGSGTTPQRTKQWQIALGIRSVDPTAIITGHTSRNGNGPMDGEAYRAWTAGYTGFNLNNIYLTETLTDAQSLAALAYGRPGPMPFFMIEAGYQNTGGSDEGGLIPCQQAFFGGALAGFFGGHDALWHMGSVAPDDGGAQSVLDAYLAGSWGGYANLSTLLRSYAWHKLRPMSGTELVTTSLGLGSGAVFPALATDGSFAMIWVPNSATPTVNLAALTGVTSVRARWWAHGTGAFTTAGAGTYAPSGTQSFTPPGNRILVLDQAT